MAIVIAVVTASLAQYIISSVTQLPDFTPHRQWEMTKILTIIFAVMFLMRNTTEIIVMAVTILAGLAIYQQVIKLEGVNISTTRVGSNDTHQKYNVVFGGIVAVGVALFVSLFMMETSISRRILSLSIVGLFGFSALVDYLVTQYADIPIAKQLGSEPKLVYRQWWISLMALITFACFNGKVAGFAMGLATVFFTHSIVVYGPDSIFTPEPIFLNKMPSASYIYNMMVLWAKNNKIIE